MIDFSKIEQYRENNRIEAKKALGGLPKSIWETYSAFANTHGGIILLGVEEWADKSLHTVDLPNPDRLIKEFWDIVNNPNKTSVNVLSSKDVFVQEVDGDHIVVINVPRAERSYKPVYVDGNPLCTYRRNGEGDYRCTKEEYQAMVRDASVKTQDMLILNEMDMTVFNKESIRSYRQRMRLSRPGHVWEALEDEDFLLKLGAVGIGSDGKSIPPLQDFSCSVTNMTSCGNSTLTFWTIRNSMTLIPVGLTVSYLPPATGAAMCMTSISGSTTS